MAEKFAKLAVLGGTGKEGKGLAYRFAKVGYHVTIGSRDINKAKATADELNTTLNNSLVDGSDNLTAAQFADIVILTVPYPAHKSALESVREALIGKILIDATVPVVPPKVTRVQMPPAGSAAQEAREILGEEVEIVDAFQSISYKHLMLEEDVACDVLVTGTSKDARQTVLKLVESAGLIGWDAGPIENSVVVEGLTSLLRYINKQYGTTHAGIKITGASK